MVSFLGRLAHVYGSLVDEPAGLPIAVSFFWENSAHVKAAKFTDRLPGWITLYCAPLQGEEVRLR